jgi:hypothetical protein
VSTPPGTPEDLDPTLARAWREVSADQPPPRLDDAIRAAARRAVQAGPRPASGSLVQRWRVPLSIAALLVVSASVTLMIAERDAHLPTAAPAARQKTAPAPGDAAEPRAAREALAPSEATKRAAQPTADAIAQQPLAVPPEPAESRAPAAGANAPQPAGPGGANTEASERKDAREAAAWRESDSPDGAPGAPPSTAQPPAAAKVEAPPPAAPAMRDEAAPVAREEAAPGAGAARAVEAESGTELRKKRESASDLESMMREAQTPGEADQPPGRARLKLQARPAAPAPLPDAQPLPEQWIERIRELRRQGLAAEAEASLEQFRERYPDFALPADLAPPHEH